MSFLTCTVSLEMDSLLAADYVTIGEIASLRDDLRLLSARLRERGVNNSFNRGDVRACCVRRSFDLALAPSDNLFSSHMPQDRQRHHSYACDRQVHQECLSTSHVRILQRRPWMP